MRSVMWITDTCLVVLDGPLYDSGHSSRLPLTPRGVLLKTLHRSPILTLGNIAADRPTTGAEISARFGPAGLDTVKIVNGTGQDAVVSCWK